MGSEKKIHLLRFESQYRLASTFMRFQEHYESPKFRGKIFSWEEFMDWYAAQKGNFTYCEDWSGFNVPSWALKPFYEGKFNPLTRKEKALLKMFNSLDGRFYIIGVYDEGGLTTIKHEIIHGLFYIFPNYRRAVIDLIGKYKTSKIRKILSSLGGYHPSVFVDEINSYLTTTFKMLEIYEARLYCYKNLRKRLKNLFAEFFGFSPDNNNERLWLNMVRVYQMQ